MQHPQVTQTQLDLWLDNPVTQALLKCFEWYQKDIQDEINSGSCVDSSSADLTSSNIHLRMGQIQALVTASAFNAVLDRYGMIEEQESEDA